MELLKSTEISEKRKVILVFLLAFMFRFLLIQFFPYPFYPVKVDDAHAYDRMAFNIVKGNGFSYEASPPYRPVIVRTPVYPFFLAGIYAIFGQAYNIVRVVQALLDSVTCFLVYIITLLCFKNKENYKQLALLTFILAAFCPFTAFFVSMLYSETLTAFLFTLSVFLFLWAITKNKRQYYFLSGIIIALAFLCRPAIFMYPFILIIVMFLINIRKISKLVLKHMFIYLVAISLVWLPWVYRNYMIFDRFIPLATGSGVFLWMGTYPPGRYEKDSIFDKDKFAIYDNAYGKDAIDIGLQLKKEAMERIKREPLKYFYYCLKRVVNLWVSSYSKYARIEEPLGELIKRFKNNNYGIVVSGELMFIIIIKGLLTLINLILVIAGAIGFIMAIRLWRIMYPVVLAPVYVTLVHAMFGHVGPRYVIPAWPIFLVFSAYGLWFVTTKINLLLASLKNKYIFRI